MSAYLAGVVQGRGDAADVIRAADELLAVLDRYGVVYDTDSPVEDPREAVEAAR